MSVPLRNTVRVGACAVVMASYPTSWHDLRAHLWFDLDMVTRHGGFELGFLPGICHTERGRIDFMGKGRITIPPQERDHGLSKGLWRCAGCQCMDVGLEIHFFVAWNHPTPRFLRKDNFFATLHLRDQVVEQTKTYTRVVMLSLVSEGRTPGQEIPELLKPGVRFFW